MRLFSALVGPYSYRVPETPDHVNVDVRLEPIEDILVNQFDYTISGNQIKLNTLSFVTLLEKGNIDVVSSMFSRDVDCVVSEEYNTLRTVRSQFVTPHFYKNVIHELESAEEIIKNTKEVHNMRARFYYAILMSTAIDVIGDKTFDSLAYTFEDIADQNRFKAIKKDVKFFKKLAEKKIEFDFIKIYSILRVDHVSKLKFFNN